MFAAKIFAAQITGTVTNGTTGRPAGGVEVTLLSLAGGMEETATARTDAQGHFALNVPDEGVQHLVRVTYQGASYHKAAPRGTTSVDVTIYDSAKKIDNLIGEGRILRVQTVGGELEVAEMFSLRNESSPPRTQMGDESFEFALPEGAKINDAMARGPGGMPVTSSPLPTGKKDHYAFSFPIRPGETQFQVVYRLPYKDSRDFSITADMPLAELGVMLPKSMAFKSSGDRFMQANDEGGMTVFVAKSVTAGQQLKFTVSGEGTAPLEAQNGGIGGGPAAASGSGMGGAPAQTTEASSSVSWYVIGGVVLIIFGGAFLAVRKRGPGAASASNAAAPRERTSGAPRTRARSAPSRAGNEPAPESDILEALKEELFQLESDRLQGRITQKEYETAKSGLEMLMRRQMKQS